MSTNRPMQIHVALVSDQILANLIPAFMERPELVYLVASRQMSQRGTDERLACQLRREAITVEVRAGAPEVGIAEIQSFAYRLAEAIDREHPAASITLNATGGTKLMALGFVDAFRDIGARIIYTDTAHRRVECLPVGRERPSPAIPMLDVLDVPGYLAAQGFRVSAVVSDSPEWCERAANRKAACKYLGQHAAELQDFIGVLNALTDQSLDEEGTLVATSQKFSRVPWGDWAAALGQLVRAKMLEWQDGSAEIAFVDEEATRFLHGGWLEEFVWHVLRDNGAFDVRLGITGAWEAGRASKNEFDVLATQRNQLLFVECKTLRHRDENDNALSYKVDSLGQDARGLFGATWLVTAREPTTVLLERAKQARIRVLGPKDLPRFREQVCRWLEGDG